MRNRPHLEFKLIGLLLVVCWVSSCTHAPSKPLIYREPAQSCDPTSFNKSPSLLLDPGHTPQKGGAMSVTGKKEVLYNDRFAERLAYALFEANPCIKILFTRMPHEEISLKERVERLNSVENAWVVSIHHDSAQEQDLVKTGQIAGEDIWKTKTPLQGFSVFVSPQNLFYSASLELAKRIGRAMIRAGRKPSFYHAQPIKGEGREIADKEMGVFHHPEIAVLLKVRHPSALVEIGFLPDVKDEQLISTDAFIEKTTRSLAHELGRGFAPVKP